MKIAVAGGSGVVGRYAVEAARTAGHDVVVLSRRTGIDVESGQGLAAALDGADVLLDTLNTRSARRGPAEDFFTTTTRRLQEAGSAAGVRHLVTLSILGIDRADAYGYYQAKQAQERAASAGPVPVTVLRAAQFYELAGQLLGRMRRGPVALVPRMRSQPVAARTVGEHLIRLAHEQPRGRVELAGPEVLDLADVARRLVELRGEHVRVVPLSLPGRLGRQLRSDAMLATPATVIDGPSLETWLQSDDARRAPL
jgi:uncharacterized protein YbjT (DUF2867 family)